MLWLICILACQGGAASGPARADALAYWSFQGDGRPFAGEAVFNLGDLDGDGADELGFVSATTAEGRSSTLYALRAGDTLDAPYFEVPLPFDEWAISDGLCEDPALPGHRNLLSLGDLDGDGLSELAFADPNTAKGSVWIVPGSAWSAPATAFSRALQIDGRADVWNFGSDLAAGDLDGDGLMDLVVGAPLTGSPARGGEVWVFSGERLTPLGRTLSADALGNVFAANRRDTLMGDRVAVSPDLDGDGLPDVLALSPACREEGVSGGVAGITKAVRAPGVEVAQSPANLLSRNSSVPTGLVALGDTDQDGVAEFALPGWRLSEEELQELAIFDVEEARFPEPLTTLQTGENSRAQVMSWSVQGSLALLAVDSQYVIQVRDPAQRSGWQKLDSVLLPCETELRGDQHRLAPGDYDGDGDQDLAVGVPTCKSGDQGAQVFVFEWPSEPQDG